MVSEKEEVVEAIEVLFRRLSVYPLLSKSCLLSIHTGGGVRILLRILSSCHGDSFMEHKQYIYIYMFWFVHNYFLDFPVPVTSLPVNPLPCSGIVTVGIASPLD